MNCTRCNKELKRGNRWKINTAPKLARFCFDCRHSNLCGFWHFKDIFDFLKGGWNFKLQK